MIAGFYNFPAQAVSDKIKQTEDWQHKNINAAIYSINDKGEKSIRKSRYNKLKNYNFWNGKLDKEEVRKIVDPFGINPDEVPVDLKHFPLLNSKIDVLAGEELSSRTEWIVRALSHDIIDRISEMEKDEVINFLLQQLQKNAEKSPDPIQTEKDFEEFSSYLKYSLQDITEMKGDKILQWLWKNPDFDTKTTFNRGFYDLMISAEEIYCVELVNNEPRPRKCNPLNIYSLGNNDSIYLDESDVIIEDGYYSPSWIIDRYAEWLSQEQIKRIENRDHDTYQNPVFSITNWGVPNSILGDTVIQTDLIEVDRIYGNQFGNVDGAYCATVVWKSLRKLGDLKYFDENGEEQHTIVPEQYKPNKANGEEVEWYWETEWWKGTRILDDIFVDVKPIPGNKCPYVGVLANVNVNRAVSMIDKGKALNVLYDVFWYRLEEAYAKYYGPVMELDIAKKPDDWSVEQWLYYTQKMSIMMVDSFREISRGQHTGTLAGNMNTTGKVLNNDMGNYIGQTQQMLMTIMRALDDITGVTQQRQGNISNSETVGGVERSVVQSSQITKYWFNLHSKCIERFLNRFLHFTQYAWKDKNKKLRYILGDLSTVIEEINGKELSYADLCVYVTSSPDDQALLQQIRQAAADSIKQGNGTLSTLVKTYYSNSMGEIAKKIEIMEERKQEEVKQQQQQQLQVQQQQAQTQQQMQQEMIAFEREKMDRDDNNKQLDRENKIQIAEMNALSFDTNKDYNQNSIPDVLEQGKLNLEQSKIAYENLSKERDAQIKRELESRKLSLEDKKMQFQKELQKQKDEAALVREKLKAKTALQNKVVGQK